MTPVRKKSITALWALAAGLLAFLVLESAVARRIGADLFLPLDKDTGAFLPGRLARLAACLVLGLALAMTERGRRLCRALDRFGSRDRGRWIVSAAVTALFCAWTLRVTVIAYMTNDDVQILRALYGDSPYLSLTPSFTHPWLCAAFRWLYRLAPGAYWYPGYQIAVNVLCMTVLGRCLYLKMRTRSWPMAAGVALHWLLGMGLILLPLSDMTFSVTAAVAGTTAAALWLCRGETHSAVVRALSDIGCAALMILCWLQRQDTGRALLCFWALALGYHLLRALGRAPRGERLRRAARPLTCAVAVAAVLLAAGQAEWPQPDDWATGYSYADAEEYRTQVMDFSLDKLSDEQLEAVGLPPELTTLLRHWYFMDERINTDTFRTITETYPDAVQDAGVQGGSGLFARLRSMISAATADTLLISSDRYIMQLMAAGFGLLVLLVLLRPARYGLAGWQESLCGLCAGGGALMLLLYLLLQGRMPLRAFLVPVIPGAAVMILMAADAPAGDFHTKPKRLAALLSGVLALGLAALCPVVARHVPYADEAVTRQEVFQFQTVSDAYANAHPEITFITNELANDLDPFENPPAYPSNLSRWGNPGVTATSRRLYASDFFRDDVQLLCDDPSQLSLLLQYLTVDNGPVRAVLIDKLPAGISIYQMEQAAPSADYTGWYEQTGMTYYFQDGQALSGEQTIQGKRYTFAPAGAACQFSAAQENDTFVYTTDAYSLISP